mmetsp:Transcript_8584/g.14435  ORF Transcript_8584/g.14435 Transcript_8584/m.14435 type:complete len:221 (+) Transcript_8584:208-870(+)
MMAMQTTLVAGTTLAKAMADQESWVHMVTAVVEQERLAVGVVKLVEVVPYARSNGRYDSLSSQTHSRLSKAPVPACSKRRLTHTSYTGYWRGLRSYPSSHAPCSHMEERADTPPSSPKGCELPQAPNPDIPHIDAETCRTVPLCSKASDPARPLAHDSRWRGNPKYQWQSRALHTPRFVQEILLSTFYTTGSLFSRWCAPRTRPQFVEGGVCEGMPTHLA